MFFKKEKKNYDEGLLIAEHLRHGSNMPFFIEKFDKEGIDILEVGSRLVCSEHSLKNAFPRANYTGFDFYPGNGVDVVGDAHELSKYFPNKKFDFIISAAVFEHFAMPWICAKEIIKLLKVGGHIYIETHFSMGTHERPQNFFHFTDKGLEILFPKALGIEKIDSGFANPLICKFAQSCNPELRGKEIPNMFCHVAFFGVKTEEVDMSKDIAISDYLGETVYPKPQ